MLSRLKVRNFALIQDLDVVFHSGMNVITGETGAGKSILIDALSLAMGKRANNLGAQNREKKCVVEAVFQLKDDRHKAFFEQHDLDFDPECIFRRELTPSGKSRSFINDTPASLKTVSALASNLLEIHAQYDNMQLMQADFTMGLLDKFASCQDLQSSYSQEYKKWKQALLRLENLKQRQASLLQEQEFNEFLYTELSEANLAKDEDESLEQELDLLSNAEDLLLQLAQASEALNAEGGSLDQLRTIHHNFGNLPLAQLSDKLKSILLELEDLVQEMDAQRDKVSLDPLRLEEVTERLNLLNSLKTKHRALEIQDLLDKQAELEGKLHTGSELESEIKELENSIQQLETVLMDMADRMHSARTEKLEQLSSALNKPLGELGMPHSQLKLNLSRLENLGSFGYSSLELLLSSDKGKSFNSIRQIASGGELSRINLIAKSIAGSSSGVSCSVLDEIDSGVSGEVARKVGALMRSMADNQQLIVITHLAQIASLGHKHLYVHKEDEGEIQTKIQELDQDGRVHEIAKMISGEQLTESAIEQSKSLLNS